MWEEGPLVNGPLARGPAGAGRTVWNLGDEVGDEEGGGDVGEVVADEFEILGDTHHSRILSLR